MNVSTTSLLISGIGGPQGQSSVALESQLARLRKELSDCVNCPSSKTQEGKTKIQALAGRIGQIESRLNEVKTDPAQSNSGSPQLRNYSNLPTSGLVNAVPSDSLRPMLGHKVDVYA